MTPCVLPSQHTTHTPRTRNTEIEEVLDSSEEEGGEQQEEREQSRTTEEGGRRGKGRMRLNEVRRAGSTGGRGEGDELSRYMRMCLVTCSRFLWERLRGGRGRGEGRVRGRPITPSWHHAYVPLPPNLCSSPPSQLTTHRHK